MTNERTDLFRSNQLTRSIGMSCLQLMVVCTLLFVLIGTNAIYAFETNCQIHDPSTVIKSGGTYWVYGTGTGIPQFSSTDRLHWTYRGQVFASAPSWVASTVPSNTNNTAWAPDIRYINGQYFLYYCYSAFGTNTSGIGVATNSNPGPTGWVDHGLVIASSGTSFNAIDPCIIQDTAGTPWVSFGSFYSGIRLIQINASNGKQSSTNRTIYTLAKHPQSSNDSIEASCITYHNGYYYLFVNWDSCCNGNKSTYNIRVGRSTSMTGPYVDRYGVNMVNGGGSMFLCSVENKNNGAIFDDEVGPGHAGILNDTDGTYFTCHYEWARDRNGASILNLIKMSWDSDNWPRVPNYDAQNGVLPGLIFKLNNQASGLCLDDPYASNTPGTIVQQWYDNGNAAQEWNLTDQGNGYYLVTDSAVNLSLDNPNGGGAAGTKMEIANTSNSSEQQWKILPLGEGYYSVTNQASGLCLDDPNASTSAGTQIQQWYENGATAQAWLFTVVPDANGIVSGATYKFTNVAANLCLDDPSGSTTLGQQMDLWTDNGYEPQHFKIESTGNGNYKITCQASALCLDDPNGSTTPGVKLQQWEDNGLTTQQWRLQRQSDGTYKITNVAGNLCIDDPYGSSTTGQLLQLYTDNGATAQRWQLTRVN